MVDVHPNEVLEYLKAKCRAAAFRTKGNSLEDQTSGFRLGAQFCKAAHESKVAFGSAEPPNDVVEFWKLCHHAKLFYDLDYGQWGLEILSPEECINETLSARTFFHDQWLATDLVIGRFLGDQEKLIVRCDSARPDYNWILVALPLYPRTDWPIVAKGYLEFLMNYGASEGEKFWENSLK